MEFTGIKMLSYFILNIRIPSNRAYFMIGTFSFVIQQPLFNLQP